MPRTDAATVDPKLDLVLTRVVDVAPSLVWAAWTKPEHLKKWFTPAPWKTIEAELDLRPGGLFGVVMKGPEGQELRHVFCYLEIVPGERLVWTNMMAPGYRPSLARTADIPPFTAIVALEPSGSGTKYTATVMHENPEDARKHDEMGFRDGWGTALDQLVAMAKSM